MEAALVETGHRACFPGHAAGCSRMLISPVRAGVGPVPAETPGGLGACEAWGLGLTFLGAVNTSYPTGKQGGDLQQWPGWEGWAPWYCFDKGQDAGLLSSVCFMADRLQSRSHENIRVYMPFHRGSKVFRAALIKFKRFLVWETEV